MVSGFWDVKRHIDALDNESLKLYWQKLNVIVGVDPYQVK